MEVEKLANSSIIIEPRLFEDERGYFFESFNEEQFNKETGMDFHPVQDNESKSSKGVFRGLHFQKPPYAQAKLVRVVQGAVYDFAVDIRKGSPTYGKWCGALLTASNHRQFFIPQGYAHGFVALEDNTIFQYKCDNYYNKASEGAVSYLDKSIIDASQGVTVEKFSNGLLEKGTEIIVSEKDKNNKLLAEIDNPFVYGK